MKEKKLFIIILLLLLLGIIALFFIIPINNYKVIIKKGNLIFGTKECVDLFPVMTNDIVTRRCWLCNNKYEGSSSCVICDKCAEKTNRCIECGKKIDENKRKKLYVIKENN